jgi:urea carboxylase
MFKKVLIANRGAIACRIIRTLRRLGIGSVAVYSEPDRHSLHVSQADEAVFIGPAPPSASYLSITSILDAAKSAGAEAIHPGYGFLSEKPEFAEACEKAGIVFIGPTPEQMRAFALKHAAREIAKQLDVPLLPGTGLLTTLMEAKTAAARIGFPVMLKSTAGGGGIGIRLCRNEAELDSAFEVVQRLGANNFGDSGAFLERFIAQARHIEVQIFGDGNGQVVALGERDCSAQRRNQKILEETPAPGLSGPTRHRLMQSAVRLVESVNYRSAGTVEFVYDNATNEFFFLEVNTRLQVEHGITEEVTGIDLVECMILGASGDLAPLSPFDIHPQGHSIEVRLYAEDAGANFQPSSGRLTHVEFPDDVRVETWVEPGTDVTPYYDPMIAKLIVHADDRAAAIDKLEQALDRTQLAGVETNLDYLRHVCAGDEFKSGCMLTSSLARFVPRRDAIEVIQGGTQTTVQDFPGRLGYWNVGVPPSGPMDALAFRLANRLVGNPPSAAAIEATMVGPQLRFASDAIISLTGADMKATLNGESVPRWQSVPVKAGSVLKIGTAQGTGMRAYLAIAGGLEIAPYLGSQSTFLLGGFGGHAGRALRSGDVIHFKNVSTEPDVSSLPAHVVPVYSNTWDIGVLYGPHGAPDFFQQEDIQMLFSADWKVHYHSDRTGVRLIGPKPKWARLDGGEAGLHPSNIHDNAYAVGTLDFTGDMPIVLGPDGPSLGGFVCPATIVEAERWKVGQLRPGDTVRFRALTAIEADAMDLALEESILALAQPLPRLPEHAAEPVEPAVIARHHATAQAPQITYRADGDRYLLVEFGDNVLDLGLRLRVHALESQLRSANLKGLIDITPGIRSLHVHYDARRLPRAALLEALAAAEQAIPDDLNISVPSRTVHLPLSWDDPQARLAAEKYAQSVRPDAPWCPSNIEFIRRINGLSSIQDVHRVVFDASYLVLGLGDVYLGAPVATPIDPRHRLVTTKYNPARTWTPENAVGIGGAYLCIYGMEGPGGYQLFGRTTQVWNTFKSTANFELGTPWLLRFFDQIRFFPVTANELLEMRDAFPHGKVSMKTEQTLLNYREHQRFLESIAPEARASKQRQQQAFSEERARWAAAGQAIIVDAVEDAAGSFDTSLVPDGCEGVTSPLTASVWNIAVQPGQRVQAGDRLIVLEAMKTELVICAPESGTVREIRCKQGALVTPGQTLAVMETAP